MTNPTTTLEKEPSQTENIQNIEKTYLSPSADVYRSEDSIRILVDLPGATDDGIDVTVKEGHLSIKAESQRSASDIRVYERVFRIDHRLNTLDMEAVLQQGVLEVRIPFHEEARPRKIEIKTR
jgi:HSP20 family molecular chaperone IbpA